MLPKLFPKCRVHNWQPVPKKLKGRVQLAVERVARQFLDDLEDFYSYSQLMSDLGMSDTSNFRRTVRKRPDFQQSLAKLGLEEATVDGRKGIQPGTSHFTDDDPGV